MASKGLDQLVEKHKPESISVEEKYEHKHHTTMFTFMAIITVVGLMSAMAIFMHQDLGPGQAYQVAIDAELYVNCGDNTVYDCSAIGKTTCEKIVDASDGVCQWGIG